VTDQTIIVTNHTNQAELVILVTMAVKGNPESVFRTSERIPLRGIERFAPRFGDSDAPPR